MSFKVGDVVQLKSGGPAMTVTETANRVLCTWFAGDDTKTGGFPAEALRQVDGKISFTVDASKPQHAED